MNYYFFRESHNLHILNIKLHQDDCVISNISEKLNTNFEILESKPISKKLFSKFKVVTLKWVKSEDNSFKFKFLLNEGFRSNFRIIKSSPEEKIFQMIIKNTILGLYYNSFTHKCVRLYPTLVNNGIEIWNIIFENQTSAYSFIDILKELPETIILKHQVFTFPLILKDELNQFIEEIFELKERINSKKYQILFDIYKLGYFNPEKKIKLSEISKEINVSKAYLSKIISDFERRILMKYIRLLFVE